MDKLLVGAGKADIRLPEPLLPDREGFTQILDPLHVRIVLLEAETRAAIVSLELTSMMGGNDMIQDRVAAITGAEYVWVTVSHTFSAPHIMLSQPNGHGGPDHPDNSRTTHRVSPESQENEQLQRLALLEAVGKAAQQAASTLREAEMHCVYGTSTINTGRDVETKDGWWLGEGSTAYADHTLATVFFDSPEGLPIAAVYNFPVQSSVLDHAKMEDGGFVISGDIAGRASEKIEGRYPVALFLCGAAGDQAPRQKSSADLLQPDGSLLHIERKSEGIVIKNRLGDELGQAVLDSHEQTTVLDTNVKISSVNHIFTVPAKVMPDRSEVNARRTPNFQENGTTQSNVEVLCIGDLALVGVKPELSASIGASIRNNSPFPFTMVATMVNGGAKYMADQEGFDHISYAAQNSPFARGAAEMLEHHALTILKKMRDS